MKKLSLLNLLLIYSIASLAQSSLHLEEYVILNQYCPGDKFAVVEVLDQDGDEEFKYAWKHNGDSSQIIKIFKEDFGKEFCVDRFCPCGSVYESCFVFDPNTSSQNKSNIEPEDVTCSGESDGRVTVYPSGNFPFEYKWNTGAETKSVSGLKAGKYMVTVEDALGCKQVLNTRIRQPRKLKLRPKLISKNRFFTAVKLQIKGGTGNYYLNGEKASKKILFTSKNEKRYEFELEDENGCSATATILLRKKYKPKKSRAVFAKLPKKQKKHKGRMKCPKLWKKSSRKL